jgi:hypothetical protein
MEAGAGAALRGRLTSVPMSYDHANGFRRK